MPEFKEIVAWMQQNVFSSPYFDITALSIMVYAAVATAYLAIRYGRRALNAAITDMKLKRIAKARDSGFKILQMRGNARADYFTKDCLERLLTKFFFGTPVTVYDGGGMPVIYGPSIIDIAQKRMNKSGADMIYWIEHHKKGEEGLRIRGLARVDYIAKDLGMPFTLHFSGDVNDWNDGMGTLLAYGVAKNMQPTLAEPDQFQPENLKEIVGTLANLFSEEVPMNERARDIIENDFGAFALHLAIEGDDPSFLNSLIDIRKERVKGGRLTDARLFRARYDLGVALVLRATYAFDPDRVKEGIAELDAVIKISQSDELHRRAQIANNLANRGRSLLNTHKRVPGTTII